MKLELSHQDLINMVKGSSPQTYDDMNLPVMMKAGEYIGGMADHWDWTNLKDLTDEELLEIYKICNKDNV